MTYQEIVSIVERLKVHRKLCMVAFYERYYLLRDSYIFCLHKLQAF